MHHKNASLHIGCGVKALRLKKHITQKELAAQFDVTVRTVKYWESGERSIPMDMLQAICKWLGGTEKELAEWFRLNNGGPSDRSGAQAAMIAMSAAIAARHLLYELTALIDCCT